MSIRTRFVAAVLTLGLPLPALAYVGPGAGLSLVGALWGLIVAVGAAIGFILMWPIRRLMRRRRKTTSGDDDIQQASYQERSSQDADEQNRRRQLY